MLLRGWPINALLQVRPILVLRLKSEVPSKYGVK